MVAERVRRRRVRTFAAAASVATVAVLGGIVLLSGSTSGQHLAQVARIDGRVTRDAGLLQPSRALIADAGIYVGDEISTSDDARVAFSFGNGFSLRLDTNSRVQVVAADRVLLERGALYIDAAPGERTATNFIVDTRIGAVRHLGTQYEVRTIAEGIQVSVREGRVAIDKDGVLHAGEAGEQLSIKENGTVDRSNLAPDDRLWQWTNQVAPIFNIENRPLVEFLDWLARETGDSIEYATPQAQQEAQQTILRGSIDGLEPQAALAAVLATTALQANDDGANRLVISARE
jgi:ferric-dicitrate binding protein FerR (iron transport regulator)